MAQVETIIDKEPCYWPIENRPPVKFEYDDLKSGEKFTKVKAWAKLQEGYPYLETDNFVDKDTFWRYYFLSLGLVDYSAVIISGPEGSGKSLIQAWFVEELGRLFDKKIAIDWSPPLTLKDSEGKLLCPVELRNAYRIFDEDYEAKIQGELNRIAKLEKQYGEQIPEEELKKLIIYDCAWGFDESQTWGDRASRTNLTQLIYRVLCIRRHMGTAMFFTYLDPSRADRLIYGRMTHLVSCSKESQYYHTCSYSIFHKRTGVSKQLHLRPADWTHIWRSYGVPQISHDVYIYLGGKKKATKPLPESIDGGDL